MVAIQRSNTHTNSWFRGSFWKSIDFYMSTVSCLSLSFRSQWAHHPVSEERRNSRQALSCLSGLRFGLYHLCAHSKLTMQLLSSCSRNRLSESLVSCAARTTSNAWIEWALFSANSQY